MPYLLHTSSVLTPAESSCRTWRIWSSVNRLFPTSAPLRRELCASRSSLQVWGHVMRDSTYGGPLAARPAPTGGPVAHTWVRRGSGAARQVGGVSHPHRAP